MAKISAFPSNSGQGLSQRQKTFIHVYLEAKTLEDACRNAKVAKGTVYNWMKDPLFQRELEQQRDELIRTAFHRLTVYLDRAIVTYVNLLTSESEAIRKGTAEGIIDRFAKLREQKDIIDRLERLEDVMHKQQKR
jgi:hypothetical protein